MISNRLVKLQKAKTEILYPLKNIIINEKYAKDKNGTTETLIRLKNRFCVLVGDHNDFRVNSITKQELIAKLNILQQFSYLNYQSTLSGEAFWVKIRIPIKTNKQQTKIISIKNHRKVA